MKKYILPSLLILSFFGFSQPPGGGVLGPGLPGVVIKDNYQEKVVQYEYVRQADAAWMKRVWRTMDLREKQNHYLYYPIEESYNRQSLAQLIRNNIKANDLQAYNSIEDNFTLPLTKEEALAIGTGSEEIPIEQPDGSIMNQILPISFDYSAVKKVRVWEEWYFDKQTSYMHVQIIGICPVLNVYDEEGEFKGEQPMFWIYFPELRGHLVKEEAFNRQNDMERRSFDHMLVNRKFSSYVIKESNVYDRKIIEYKTGLDALLEGQKIHEEIRDWEQDLWEY